MIRVYIAHLLTLADFGQRFRFWVYYLLGFISWSYEPTMCPICGGKEFKEEVKATVSNVVSEEEISCLNCNEFSTYWAYGEYEPW